MAYNIAIMPAMILGHFGCVYAATLRDSAMKNPVAVAVKTIEGINFIYVVLELLFVSIMYAV